MGKSVKSRSFFHPPTQLLLLPLAALQLILAKHREIAVGVGGVLLLIIGGVLLLISRTPSSSSQVLHSTPDGPNIFGVK